MFDVQTSWPPSVSVNILQFSPSSQMSNQSMNFFFALGFLYVSKDNPGNYALQDIYTALHWLKNHIVHFNGDPNRITLYGTESGAVLASLVVMLETVNGL